MVNNPDSNLFFDNQYRDVVKQVVHQMFPVLNDKSVALMTRTTYYLLNYIAVYMNFNRGDKASYLRQLSQNSYQDLKALILLQLPFIDDPSPGGDKLKTITSFREMVQKRKDDGEDPFKTEPAFEYSNYQYGRIDRGQKKGQDQLRTFNQLHFAQNHKLLKETIHNISNKMMVNWVDVLPLTADELRGRAARINKYIEAGLTYHSTYEGDSVMPASVPITVADIYEIMANDMYKRVKKLKWLLYVVRTSEDETGHVISYVELLKQMFPIERLINGESWSDMTDSEKLHFEQEWEIMKDSAIKGGSYNSISTQNLREVLRNLVIFFDNYHDRLYGTDEHGDQSGYVQINRPQRAKNNQSKEQKGGDGDQKDQEQEEGQNDNDEDDYDLTFESIVPSLESFSAELVIRFLSIDLNKFMVTWYGHRMFPYDLKQKIHVIADNLHYADNGYGGVLSYKNIYNLAQSLVTRRFTTDKERARRAQDLGLEVKNTVFGFYWRSLTEEERKIIVRRLNPNQKASEVFEWFNISGYIRRTAQKDDDDDDDDDDEDDNTSFKKQLMEYNNSIFELLLTKLGDVIVDCMNMKGGLSKFKPNPRYTDEATLTGTFRDQVKRRQQVLWETVFSKKEDWRNTHHFLTDELVSQMGPYYKEKNGEIVARDFFEYMSDLGAEYGFWGNFYAMNWISQIAFFHRYYHSRVTFVTGSTGVGKSTQIPKLITYALKIVDHQIGGHVVCTQPRKAPTSENAGRIAAELAVPIEGLNKHGKKVSLDRYSLQYQHSDKKHVKEINRVSLKMVTDGLLYVDLQKSPLLKRTSRNSDPSKVRYSLDNTYDVVIVDESHEHNTNMDLILTLMRYALYYNNQLRLFIVSATMDDDEPTYRRYYRDINDNRMYPFNTDLVKYGIDRINLERRLHISPPGKTTRFTVKEHYVGGGARVDQVEQIFRQTKSIIESSSSGDILVFQPGQQECINLAQRFNEKIGGTVLAIPFYSKMTERDRGIVQKIHVNLGKMNVPMGKTFGVDYHELSETPINRYRRCIIVATNIAEASITIQTLKFVVDDGYQKIVRYNPALGQGLMESVLISDSSRQQRKGRVGRTSSGTVYYMYSEEMIKGRKTSFNISISDLTDNIMGMLLINPHETPLISSELNPNNPANFGSIKYNELKKMYVRGLDKIIATQYFKDGKFWTYEGDKRFYDYENSRPPSHYHQTGLTFETITDALGEFYIIHPEEVCLLRNIVGRVIGVKSGKPMGSNSYKKSECDYVSFGSDGIESQKFDNFWEVLESYQLMQRDRFEAVGHAGPISTKANLTPRGQVIRELATELIKIDSQGTDLKMKVSYLQSVLTKKTTQVLDLFCTKTVTKGSLKNLSRIQLNRRGHPEYQLELTKTVVGSPGSDLDAILRLFSLMRREIKYFLDLEKHSLDKSSYRKRYEGHKEIYLTEKKAGVSSSLSSDMYELLVQMDRNKRLNNGETTDKEYLYATDNFYQAQDLKERLSSQDLQGLVSRWSSKHFLEAKTIEKLLKSRIYLHNLDRKLREKIDGKLIKPLYDQIQKPNDDSLMTTLLHGYGRDLAFRLHSSPFYLPLSLPRLDQVVTLAKIKPYLPYLDSLMTGRTEAHCYLHLQSNMAKYEIAFLHQIPIKEVVRRVPHLFNGVWMEMQLKKIKEGREEIYPAIAGCEDSERKLKLVSTKTVGGFLQTNEELRRIFQ